MTHLGLGLSSMLVQKSQTFGCSTLAHVWSVSKTFHSLAPALNVWSRRHHSLRGSGSVPLHTITSSTVSLRSRSSFSSHGHRLGIPAAVSSHAVAPLLSVVLPSSVCGTAVFSRGFGTSPRSAAKDLSDKGDVVYRGTISGMIRGVKIFSLSTSVIGVCLQPMLLFGNQELPSGLKFAIGGFINFFVFMNPFIIHYIAKKYVTELRWNRATGVFTAATWSIFVLRKELQFTAEDVKVPDVPGMFTFLEAKGTPLFLDPQVFENTEAYIHLMGFNKPLDWELPQKQEGGSEPQKR